MGRAPCCDKTKVKRGPWSPQEDTTLKNFLETYGTGGNWISLPQKAGLNRCGKSCRLRWLNYLRPDIKHGNFTDEEDTIILTLYHNIGSRWSVIASSLPGRTDNDVKNYWNTKLKKKFFASPSMTSSSTSMTSNNMFHGRSYYGNSSNSADSCLDMVAAPSQQLPGPMEFPGNVELNACNNRGYASSHSTSSASLENTASSSNDEYFGSMLMSLDQLLMSDFDFEEINQSFAFSNFELAG